MSAAMMFGMVAVPAAMNGSNTVPVKAASVTGSIPGTVEEVGAPVLDLNPQVFVGYQKTIKTTSKKPTTTTTKKSALSKNYANKLTKKTITTTPDTKYSHGPGKDVTTYTKKVVTTTKVYYKKTLTTTVKTDISVTTTTTNYIRSGSPNIMHYMIFSNNSLPFKIVSAFREDNIKVTLNSGMSNDGFFSSSNKTIQLKRNTDYSFLHEIGHYVNYKEGNVANSTEFKNIFASEKSKYRAFYSDICMKFSYGKDMGQYGRTNSSEYFAECFRDYYFSQNSRNRLKSNCPKTYNYIVKAINNFK